MSEYTRECLREDEEFVLSRGEHPNHPDSPMVLLLAPASNRPALEVLQKLKHEYSLREELDSAWAVRPIELMEQSGSPTLVFEDPGGETLDRSLPGPMELTRFLRLAIRLATALTGLHKKGLIHKDIKPANVLVNPATDDVRLMGFGIASRLQRERQAPEPPELIAGTLAYMAPEQTGRMNRSIDSRSDLYALGVTLYEMLTGSLPFTASHPMEWVHCHIARQPTLPRGRLKGVPGMVSAIVMKLLAKTAEERYQTAAGLERDLRLCLREWETQHRVDDFRLGEQDIAPNRLVIPEKLYGREREIEVLLAAFDRIVAGGRPELVLVSGYSGVGKSSVVNELHKPLVPPRGLFASGKFDQYKRDVPYATLAQAFQSLLRPLLTKSESELSKWRDALREAVDPNGQLIVDLVPELKFVIGEQSPVPEVSPQDAQARFQLVFGRFIGVFARQEHPLALFLDDLQWLDTATLDLIAHLVTQSDVRHLVLIGAYRNNEVSPTHPLIRKLEAIRQAGAIVQNIVLAPLSRENLAQLIADSIHCEPDRVAQLAELVHEKTAGNPFFAIQFISALAEEGLLTFDHSTAQWLWYLDRIRGKGYTDNVVDLLVGKLSRLPTGTQEALRQLACFGNSVEFALLRVIYRDSTEEMHSQLWEAVRIGFIFRSKDSYRFLHDRVQEAAYSLTPEDLRAQTHLRIGRILAAGVPPEKLEERIFEIVNQLDGASHLITSVEERERVAELNLIAARRAKNAIAYGAAIKYLSAGRAMLTEASWGQRYELIFSIEHLRAECELLTADMEAAEKRLSMLAARANRAHDLAVVTRLQLTLYTALDRVDRCVEICLEYLQRGGTNWSTHPTRDEIQREYDRIWSLLGDRQIEDLLDLPLIDNPDILDVLEVLTEFLTPAMFFDQDLSALVICRMVNLSLDHGNSDASCLAYEWFGIIAGPRFGEYEGAFKFGQLGYDLLEGRGLKRYEARTYMWFGLLVPWTKHARCCRDFARHCFDVAYRMGDFTYAAYSFTLLITSFLFVGDPLAEVQAEAEKGVEFAERARVGLAADIVRSDIQLIRTLRLLTNNFGSFNDKDFDEAAFEGHLASNPALAQVGFGYWTLKAEAHFFAGNYASAVDASAKAQQLLWAEPTVLEQAAFRFYAALSHAAAWDSASPDERQQHFEALAAHHKELEIWAERCPENFENRAAQVGAEIARIEGRLLDAQQLYEKAIRSAHTNGFVHNEAVACEVAARFYAAQGLDTIADSYLREARYCYLRWGAGGKVRQLDQLYPHLRKQEATSSTTSTIVAPVEHLDLGTVIKVSQTVSAEMDLDKLIDTVVRAAIEHAGAARGLLILSRGDGQGIEAEATTIGDEVMLRRKESGLSSVPQSIVNYVVRTHEFVILDDASSENRFATDTYFSQHHARSVLCLPLMTQGKLVGLLYLENDLAPNVFTPNRIAVLKLLASQAAISVENTRLYADLSQREAKIRRLVEANVVGIVMWNLEGSITGANEAFLRMVQYSREDLASGRVRWTDLTPAEWCDRDERAVAELKANGVFQPFEKEYFRKDGSRVPILLGGALFEESGNEGVAFVLDLTEQEQAEHRYRVMVETASDAVVCMDENGAILLANPTTMRVFGYEPAELIGKPLTVLMPEVLRKLHEDGFRRYLATGQRHINWQGTELTGLRKNGQEFPVEVSFGDLTADGHHIFTGFVRDISERKQAEERLRRSEERWRSVFENSAIGVALTDLDGRFIASNPVYQRMLGYTEEELRNISFLDVTHEDYREHNLALVDELLAEERTQFQIEKQYRRKDGTLVWASVNVSMVLSSERLPRFLMALSEDITERKRAEEALAKARAELAHAARVLSFGALTASIAHEVNQPLSGIITNAGTCLRMLAADPPELDGARATAQRILRDGNRASEVVQRLRTLFARKQPMTEPVDLNDAAREVLALLSSELQRSQVILRTNLYEDLPTIRGDRVQLQQVILNLILNAADAMSGINDRPRNLLVTSSHEDSHEDTSWVRLSVCDSGAGIDPQNVEKLFDAFYTTKSHGMGIGLSVSRSIIESHEGWLRANANDGPGATFSFAIPCRSE
jgi:PAS domain S-box-containing protein